MNKDSAKISVNKLSVYTFDTGFVFAFHKITYFNISLQVNCLRQSAIGYRSAETVETRTKL